jgi:pimeloyl-ACP methyl ester carboxylesterase
MFDQIDAVWISSSPSLQWLDMPLLGWLSRHLDLIQWEYCLDLDEACALDRVVDLLLDFLQNIDRPVHLLGHGLGGVIGLLASRHSPEQVRSLTLLGVAAQPGLTWHTEYYTKRHQWPCSQLKVLSYIAKRLFNSTPSSKMSVLIDSMAQDLEASPSPHSLWQLSQLPPGGIEIPMMIAGSQTDVIVSLPNLQAWQSCLKTGDFYWECPQGGHFFHYCDPKLVGENILGFWHHQRSRSDVAKLTRAYQRANS